MNQAATLLDGLVNDQSLMQEMAKRFGLPEEAVVSATQSMIPALSRGIERNIEQPGGAESLLNAVQSGNHQRYLENPALLEQPESIEDGNAILGHILGSKDVSRNVAGFASQQTGIDSSILKQMLPILGAAAMGILSQKMSQGGAMSTVPQQGGSGLMGMLTGFLDADKDGSMMDDLLGMTQKYFQSRNG
jgi:hypothetical protein